MMGMWNHRERIEAEPDPKSSKRVGLPLLLGKVVRRTFTDCSFSISPFPVNPNLSRNYEVDLTEQKVVAAAAAMEDGSRARWHLRDWPERGICRFIIGAWGDRVPEPPV